MTLFVVIGCEKEQSYEKLDSQNDNTIVPNNYFIGDYEFNNTNFSELENSSVFENLLSTFNLKSTLSSSKNIYGKRPNNNWDFSIDTSTVKEINKENYISYSFAIYRNENKKGFIENLVIENKSGAENAYILSYVPDKKWLTDHLNNIETPFYGHVEIEELQTNTNKSTNKNLTSKSSGCSKVVIVVERACPCEGHWPGQACSCSTLPSSQYNEVQVCGGSGGGGGFIPPSGGGTNTGSGIVLPPPSGDGDNTVTTPVSHDGSNVAVTNLTRDLTLSSRQISWLNNNTEVAETLLLYLIAKRYSVEGKNFSSELINLMMLDPTVSLNALNFMLEAEVQDKIYNAFDEAFLNSVNQFMDIDATASNPGIIQLQIYFSTKCAVLRYNHPDWSDAKIYWEASKDFIHIALDGFGMIPVVGEIADLTNGVLYLIEGDGVNATLSFAATVPIVGWGATTGKYVFKITASTLGTKVRLTWKVLENGIVYFGSSGNKLRKVLGITSSALQAHHLMPWALRNNDVIQKAAKSGSAFHMNEALNGIAVASWRNQPNHNVYNNLIENKLNAFNNLNPNANVDDAYNFVSNLIADVRDWVINNPNSHLNDLVLP